MIDIREATNSDLRLLREIGMQTFADSFSMGNTPAIMESYLEASFNADQIKKEISEYGAQFFLAFDDATIAGYAKLRRNSEVDKDLGKNSIELQRIYVVKNYIGTKVGALLMQSCIDYAQKNRFEWMWLGVWELNRKAQNFYFQWGFEKFGEHLFQMGEDPQTDWLMRKNLTKGSG